ncbi:MAG: phosphatidate cytidylyltransferase [Bacilli bacterium]|nr:phosphatidate cytidylyltransferase [Bacilli bacterium]
MKKEPAIVPNELTAEGKKSLKVRLISAAIAIAIAAPCVILGDWFLVALFGVALTVAVLEIIRCSKVKYTPFLYIFIFVCAALLSYWPMLANVKSWGAWTLYTGYSTLNLSVLVLVVCAFLFFFLVIIDKSFTVRDACFIFTMVFLISLGFESAMFLRFYPCYRFIEVDHLGDAGFSFFNNFESSMLIFYALLGSFLTDAGAYFFGIFFGHNKINPRISEKKTWAGFFGGIFTSMIITGVFAFVMAYLGHPIGNILTLDKWYHIVILSIGMPFFSTLGDFVFSSFKRFYEIKDFGKLIPGHGGILDRVDSVIFACIFVAIYIACFYCGESGLPILI